MEAVPESNSLKMLKFVHEKGFPWANNTCEALLRTGNYEMLKYAHENGALWTTDTVISGLKTKMPSVPCLQYAIENGCPWDPQATLAQSRSYNHPLIVAWIQKYQAMNQ